MGQGRCSQMKILFQHTKYGHLISSKFDKFRNEKYLRVTKNTSLRIILPHQAERKRILIQKISFMVVGVILSGTTFITIMEYSLMNVCNNW